MKLLLQQVDALNFCNILFEVTGADNIWDFWGQKAQNWDQNEVL